MNEYNPKLAKWLSPVPSKDAGINNIQLPGQVEHVIWQTRYKLPTQYELDLIESLKQAFAQGITDLEALVESLNQQGLRQESGELWNSQDFQDEMQRLGY
jgi:hypothetical protein